MSNNGALQEYHKSKNRLSEKLTEMQELLSAVSASDLLRECHGLREKLASNQFNLVVMGQFKRGKSTLINALLESQLLPVAVVPLTSVVTLVRFAERPHAAVHFCDGRQQEIDMQDIDAYTTERKNPNNQKQVARVEIGYPAPFLHDGVRLIDTPGVGSVFDHNTATAYEFLPQADAVLFLVTADPPISAAERQFLKDVREHAGKIFFIKNKIDHLSPEDLDESLAFTRQVLTDHMQITPRNLKIFPLSAKWGLEARLKQDGDLLTRSRLLELQQSLQDFLVREKGTLLLENVRRRAGRILKEACGLLELESKAITTPQAQLTEKLRAFQQHQREIQQTEEEMQHLLNGGVRRILERYDDRAKKFKQAKLPELEAKLRVFFEQEATRTAKKLAASLEQALCRELDRIFVPWRKQQEEKVNDEFVALAERLTGQTNAAIDGIYQIAGQLFDIHLERYQREERLADERYFYFKYDAPISALDDFENLFTFTVATLVSKKIILNKTLARMSDLFDRQCGRVRADFFDRLRESSFALQGRLMKRVQEAFREIESLVKRARHQRDSGAVEVAQRLQELQRRRQRLVEIEQDLSQLNAADPTAALTSRHY